jgi:hypothetical protein
MIKAYLAGISTQYEGEDVQIQYCIYDEQELISKNSLMLEYQKPAIVGQIALLTLLNKMGKYRTKEIIIIVNDSAINQIIKETTATKNEDVKKMARRINKKLSQFKNVVIKDVSKDHEELVKWNDILKP